MTQYFNSKGLTTTDIKAEMNTSLRESLFSLEIGRNVNKTVWDD